MNIQSIKLINFRNYIEEIIPFQPGFNMIYGQNGQGKTNLLEAIFMCSTIKSTRTGQNKELVNRNTEQDFYTIYLQYEDTDAHTIKIQYKNNRREVFYNDIKMEKIGELMTRFNSILFTPDDLFLIKGGPDKRRKFLDILICQTDRLYFYGLQKYQRVLKQKNGFLKMMRNNGEKDAYLDVLNTWIVRLGTQIIQKRSEVVRTIEKEANRIHQRVSNGKEELTLQYKTNAGRLQNDEDFEESIFQKKLLEGKKNEIQAKTSLIGPHRDDVQIRINDMDARYFASQGQIRTAALSLILSQASYMENKTDQKPVVLLDDVLSELDSERKQLVMQRLVDNQIIITGTKKADVQDIKDPNRHFIFVQNGKITI